MNATKWQSLTEFVKFLGRESIVNVKEDEKDGLMIAWKNNSLQALERRKEIEKQEAAEARSSAGEDKMLKRMEKRAREDAKARAKEKGTEAQKSPKETSEPPAPKEGAAEAAPQAPVKFSFGLKPKTLPTTKPEVKKQSIFKRARTEDGENSVKRVKL